VNEGRDHPVASAMASWRRVSVDVAERTLRSLFVRLDKAHAGAAIYLGTPLFARQKAFGSKSDELEAT
jgi:hypothetical protein